jgi:hypothetical protein
MEISPRRGARERRGESGEGDREWGKGPSVSVLGENCSLEASERSGRSGKVGGVREGFGRLVDAGRGSASVGEVGENSKIRFWGSRELSVAKKVETRVV